MNQMSRAIAKISDVYDSINGNAFTVPSYVNRQETPNGDLVGTYTFTLAVTRMRQWLGINAYDWSFAYTIDPGIVTTDIDGFTKLWNLFCADHDDDFNRAWAAWSSKYNALYNNELYENNNGSETFDKYKETTKTDETHTTDYGTGLTDTQTYGNTTTHAWDSTHKEGPMNAEGDGIDGDAAAMGTVEHSGYNASGPMNADGDAIDATMRGKGSWSDTGYIINGPAGATEGTLNAQNMGRNSSESYVYSDDGTKRAVSETDQHGADIEKRNANHDFSGADVDTFNTTDKMTGATMTVDHGSSTDNTTSNTGSNSNTRTGTITQTDKTGTNGNTKEITGGKTNGYELYKTGNIGEKTTQDMVLQEINMRAQTDMTKYIMDMFIRECLYLLPEIGDDD